MNKETENQIASASNVTETPEQKQEVIEKFLTGYIARADAELFAKNKNEVKQKWNWEWDEKRGVEWNIYLFCDRLEPYKRTCRRWEEHHNGSCCVVERVRDEYVMPRVREFITELENKLNSGEVVL